MASMRQYDPDPPAEDENTKDRPKDDPVVDLFPDDDNDDRSKDLITPRLLIYNL